VSSRPHPGDAFFGTLGDRLGEAYLRYSFTKGTDQEIAFLTELLSLPPGARVLDVGCGPGRHAVELARNYAVVGVDASSRLLEVGAARAREAGASVSFFEVDARRMPFDDEFDAVLSLQGAFGFMGRDDALVLRRMTEATRSGGRVIATAANSYFVASNLPEQATLDASEGILHERTTIRDEDGREHHAELWTSLYTARELKLLALGVGLVPEDVWAIEPGSWARRPPDAEHPELMLVASRP
jgi:SAM-dependent methyltransferase